MGLAWRQSQAGAGEQHCWQGPLKGLGLGEGKSQGRQAVPNSDQSRGEVSVPGI